MIIELSLWHDCRAVAGKFRDRRFVDVATATQRRAGRRGYLIVAGRQRCHRRLSPHAPNPCGHDSKPNDESGDHDASSAPHFTRNAARMDAMKTLTLR